MDVDNGEIMTMPIDSDSEMAVAQTNQHPDEAGTRPSVSDQLCPIQCGRYEACDDSVVKCIALLMRQVGV